MTSTLLKGTLYRTVAAAAFIAATASVTSGAAFAQSITIGSEGAIPPLDPHRVSGTVALRVIDAIYEPLVREDLSEATGTAPEIVPALAEDFSISDDGLTYRFQIREGVSFHDGSELSADAVQANFDRLMDRESSFFDERASGNLAFITNWIDHTEVDSDGRFVMVLKRPFSGMTRLLTDRRMAIISPAAMDANPGDELGFAPAGTGPFMLDVFEQGQSVSLQRNADYWGGMPGLESIEFRPISDPSAMAFAMITDQIDVIPSASAEQVAQLSSEDNLEIQYTDPANSYFIRLNTRADYTDNPEFRQALNYAVNREAIGALFGGQASPLGSPVPIANEVRAGSENYVTEYAYDLEKAQELLSQSGVSLPVTLNILSPNSGPGFGLATQLMTLVQQDLSNIGVDLQVQYMEFSALLSATRAGLADDVHGDYNGWTTGADAGYWLERMFGGNHQPPNGVNRGWYENAQVDELFTQGRAAVVPEEILTTYAEASGMIAEDAPWIFLYQDRLPRVIRASISGIEPAGSVYFNYANITVD
ncbi:MAG: peptide/nickel transport system substrate-binding protein [Rhodobacteraceae bacterium HLUCCA12]|nr:MAG: peptide/nickel transport system substrate-binding protein [Rhodobacteraceae bacterium HLUCCA12]